VPTTRSRVIAGVLAGCAAAALGGGWQVATRQSTAGAGIAPLDLTVLRYVVPALVLLPALASLRGRWRTLDPRIVLWLVLGSGLPFGLMAIGGSRFAPAAHMGVLVAGASPLLAAAFAWLLWRERPSRARGIGLALVALGVAVLGLPAFASGGSTWIGDAMFLVAAALWAAFTLAFRRSGLTPWQAVALVNAASAVLLLPWLAWNGLGSLVSATPAQLLWAFAWQSVIAGLAGVALFMMAIERLGAAPAAAFGALAPVVSAIGGWWWLGERLGAAGWAAVAATATGVAFASGAFERRGAVT
jgi:drug/metabolite transporter (DMT)-like permease